MTFSFSFDFFHLFLSSYNTNWNQKEFLGLSGRHIASCCCRDENEWKQKKRQRGISCVGVRFYDDEEVKSRKRKRKKRREKETFQHETQQLLRPDYNCSVLTVLQLSELFSRFLILKFSLNCFVTDYFEILTPLTLKIFNKRNNIQTKWLF